MKYLLVTLSLLFLSCASVDSQGKLYSYDRKMFGGNYKTAFSMNNTVSIISLCPDGGTPRGTGFIIQDNLVITAKHVVRCSNDETPLITGIKTHKGDTFQAAMVASYPELDVSVLVFNEDLGENVFTLSSKPLKVGDKLCSRTSISYVEKCGEVLEVGDGYVYTSWQTYPGDSGSPVYDSNFNIRGHVTHLLRYVNGETITVILPSTKYHDLSF